MEVRKVQTTAAGTFLVTIPKEWASKMGLSKGGAVSMELEGGDLTITPVAKKRPTKARPLDIDRVRDRKMLELSIGAAYIQGHDVTEIASKGKILPEQKHAIRETAENLVGVEIAEEYSDRVVLQNLVDPRVFDLDKSMEKFCDSSIAVLADAMQGLKSGDGVLAQDAFERGLQSTKLYKLLLRLALQILRNRKLRGELKTYDVDGLVARIMAIKDIGRSAYYSYRVAQHVTETGAITDYAITSALEKMARTTIRMQQNAFDAFMKKDLDLASGVISRMDEVRKAYETVLVSSPGKIGNEKRLPFSLIVRDVRGIAGYAVALADDAVLAAFN